MDVIIQLIKVLIYRCLFHWLLFLPLTNLLRLFNYLICSLVFSCCNKNHCTFSLHYWCNLKLSTVGSSVRSTSILLVLGRIFVWFQQLRILSAVISSQLLTMHWIAWRISIFASCISLPYSTCSNTNKKNDFRIIQTSTWTINYQDYKENSNNLIGRYKY